MEMGTLLLGQVHLGRNRPRVNQECPISSAQSLTQCIVVVIDNLSALPPLMLISTM